MLRYPHITGHALCVVAAAVGLFGSFCDYPGAIACAAAAGFTGFCLLMGWRPRGLARPSFRKALNRPTPPRGG